MSNRITGAKPTECPDCEGLGYTKATGAEMKCRRLTLAEREEYGFRPDDWVEVRTVKRGSGCPKCKGVGQAYNA